MERDPEAQWVMARLEAIAPAWTPDAALARALVRADDLCVAAWRRTASQPSP